MTTDRLQYFAAQGTANPATILAAGSGGHVQQRTKARVVIHFLAHLHFLWVGRDPHLLIMPLMDGLGHESWLRPIICRAVDFRFLD
jgi:hypothetical protein